MEKRNIIVIGASAGGFEALRKLVAELPNDLDAVIFIVWHMSPDIRSILPDVLNRVGGMPVSGAKDGEIFRMGHIYVAIPDRHLLLLETRMRVTKGPKENRFRPAIDPLFRSAAFTFGPRVIGVVLSGALDDGSAGLWAIKAHGGIAVVQDPVDAEVSSMPESALQAVKADHIVPMSGMAALLTGLVKQDAAPLPLNPSPEVEERTEIEINIAMEKNNSREIFNFAELTQYTCPECHGVLSAITEDGRIRFRCHTGHAFSADSLLSLVTESIEESLWSTVRNIKESIFLLNQIGDHFAEINEPKIAGMYFKKAKEAQARAQLLRKALEEHEQLANDMIQQQAEESS